MIVELVKSNKGRGEIKNIFFYVCRFELAKKKQGSDMKGLL